MYENIFSANKLFKIFYLWEEIKKAGGMILPPAK